MVNKRKNNKFTGNKDYVGNKSQTVYVMLTFALLKIAHCLLIQLTTDLNSVLSANSFLGCLKILWGWRLKG